MNKEQILQLIKQVASSGLISQQELDRAFTEGVNSSPQSSARNLNISEILYFIGGLIVVVGISVLIYQNWNTLNPLTRILVTLGSSLAAFVVGTIFYQNEKLQSLGDAFHLVAALVMPLGLFVTFDAAGVNTNTAGFQSLTFSVLFITYVLSYLLFKKDTFIIFSITFGTIAYFCLTNQLASNSPYLLTGDFNSYRILLAGVSYIFLGYYFAAINKTSLSGPLYGFGILAFLGASLVLGGWTPNQNIFWELTFPGFAFGTILSSFYFKSRAFLVFGTIFLMVYILKITAEYFSGSLGWPVALVFAGLLLIAVGYFAFYLNRKINKQ